MVCGKCGNELKEGTKFCIKCGYKTLPLNEKMNRLVIPSLILMLIGILSFVSLIFIDLWITIILRFFSDLLFFCGVILAFISLYKGKNKIIMIGGIISVAIYIVLSFLSIFLFLGGGEPIL